MVDLEIWRDLVFHNYSHAQKVLKIVDPVMTCHDFISIFVEWRDETARNAQRKGVGGGRNNTLIIKEKRFHEITP